MGRSKCGENREVRWSMGQLGENSLLVCIFVWPCPVFNQCSLLSLHLKVPSNSFLGEGLSVQCVWGVGWAECQQLESRLWTRGPRCLWPATGDTWVNGLKCQPQEWYCGSQGPVCSLCQQLKWESWCQQLAWDGRTDHLCYMYMGLASKPCPVPPQQGAGWSCWCLLCGCSLCLWPVCGCLPGAHLHPHNGLDLGSGAAAALILLHCLINMIYFPLKKKQENLGQYWKSCSCSERIILK